MSFLEHSGRVPLIVAAPGVRAQTWNAPCSLVDLTPTFRDVAGCAEEPGMPLDRVSLWPTLASGAPSQTEAIAEYCVEMTPGVPVFMIRRGQFKYLHCDLDPPQLYDVDADPMERTNLAGDPADTDVASAFAREAAERWNSETIMQDVLASQKR